MCPAEVVARRGSPLFYMRCEVDKTAFTMFATLVATTLTLGAISAVLGFSKHYTMLIIATGIGFALFSLLFDLHECEGSQSVLPPGFGTAVETAVVVILFLIALAEHTSPIWIPAVQSFISSLYNALTSAINAAAAHGLEIALFASATSLVASTTLIALRKYDIAAVLLFAFLISAAMLVAQLMH